MLMELFFFAVELLFMTLMLSGDMGAEAHDGCIPSASVLGLQMESGMYPVGADGGWQGADLDCGVRPCAVRSGGSLSGKSRKQQAGDGAGDAGAGDPHVRE